MSYPSLVQGNAQLGLLASLGQKQAQPNLPQISTRQLFNDIAKELNKPPEELSMYADKLEAEFIVNSNDIRELTEEEWKTFNFPLGLVKRLKKLTTQQQSFKSLWKI